MGIKDRFSLKLRELFSLIISLPITVYVNFRCLPFNTALKLPIFVGYRTRIGKLSRIITFGCKPTTFMIRIGWGGTEGRDDGKNNIVQKNGTFRRFLLKAEIIHAHENLEQYTDHQHDPENTAFEQPGKPGGEQLSHGGHLPQGLHNNFPDSRPAPGRRSARSFLWQGRSPGR